MAFTFAALFAVFLQAFVVQTHIHSAFAPSAYENAAKSGASVDAAQVASATDHQQGCIICQALAANGGATLTDAARAAAQSNAGFETAALAVRRAPRVLAHAWQSRAPPIAA